MKLSAFQTVSLILAPVVFAALTVILIISRAKAAKIGVLKTVLPRNKITAIVCGAFAAAGVILAVIFGTEGKNYSAYADDLERRGTSAFEDHYNITLTDNSFETLDMLVETELQKTEKLASDNIGAALGCGLFAASWGFVLLILGVRITKDGIMTFIDFEPRPAFATNKLGEICFCTEKEPNKAVVKFPAVREYLKLFKRFIIRDDICEQPSDEPIEDALDETADEPSNEPNDEHKETVQAVDGGE